MHSVSVSLPRVHVQGGNVIGCIIVVVVRPKIAIFRDVGI